MQSNRQQLTSLPIAPNSLAACAALAICLWAAPGTSTAATAPQQPPATTELVDLWEGPAPDETTRQPGTALPQRPEEQPPVTRITGITQPQLAVCLAKQSTVPRRAVLILPGGGFRRVVVDKEGTEIATWLNDLGISAFVLRYRTADDSTKSPWLKPLQDAQRAMALIRSRAAEWQIDPDQLGVAGFSAGGQTAARLLGDGGQSAYRLSAGDPVDRLSHQPDFAMLIYPWNLWNPDTEQLLPELQISPGLPPVFLVHTHDDSASSLSSAMFYAALRKHRVPAELHVFASGGHGYGLRQIAGSRISSWPELAAHWLQALPTPDERK
ncbi:MAG: alpha/beta hydrolase [Planctomycetaceae bacterium]